MLKALTRLLGSALLVLALLTNAARAELLLASVTEQSAGSALVHKLRVFFNEAKSTYHLELDVTNVSDGPQTLVYPSGEEYDFAVFQGSQMLWSHNMNRFHVQYEGTKDIGFAETLSYRVEWDGSGLDYDPLPPGMYSIHGFHMLKDQQIELETVPLYLPPTPNDMHTSTRLSEDVPLDHWAYKGCAYFAESGKLEGYPAGYFSSGNELTRLDFAEAVWRLSDFFESKGVAELSRPELCSFEGLSSEFAGEIETVELIFPLYGELLKSMSVTKARQPETPTPVYWAHRALDYFIETGRLPGYPEELYFSSRSFTRQEIAAGVYALTGRIAAGELERDSLSVTELLLIEALVAEYANEL